MLAFSTRERKTTDYVPCVGHTITVREQFGKGLPTFSRLMPIRYLR